MHDQPRPSRAITRLLSLLLAALLLAACGGPSSTASDAPATADPAPGVPTPGAPSADPSDGLTWVPPLDEAVVVTPRPGQLDVRAVNADTLHAAVVGRVVTIAIDWWTGVEPCSMLDTILVETGAQAYAITLREGRGPGEVACIAIAERHRAFVELGELAPGTYTISDATGGAAPIEVVVS